MDKILFLDLEETLIESWTQPTLIIDKIITIKNFCKENKITKATMFSLAICNEKEKEEFDFRLKQLLENCLEISLDVVLLDLVFKEIIIKRGIIAEPHEFCDIFIFNMKEQPFLEWISLKDDKNKEFILFDDMISNKDILLRDKNIKITLNKI
jgi:hypothetical protein